ncbi:hypothetical protein ACJX0J_005308, partial [Zea mays]
THNMNHILDHLTVELKKVSHAIQITLIHQETLKILYCQDGFNGVFEPLSLARIDQFILSIVIFRINNYHDSDIMFLYLQNICFNGFYPYRIIPWKKRTIDVTILSDIGFYIIALACFKKQFNFFMIDPEFFYTFNNYVFFFLLIYMLVTLAMFMHGSMAW